MRISTLISIVIASLVSIASFNATAANVKVIWTGKVPTSDCASQPISNQVAFREQSNRCQVELKLQEPQIYTKNEKKMVSFDV